MKDWIKELDRVKFGSGTYSQSYQDELLTIIFDNIGTINTPPYCVEFGFNSTSLTKGSGANTADLILHKNWNSLLLDGKNENPSINLHRHFLTSSNICEVLSKYNAPHQPEYTSIDVDSVDLWLFDALAGNYRAMVFSIEYNPNFPLNKAVAFPNDPTEKWQGDRAFGASLKALKMVAAKHGYSLLWVVKGLDAFFIRNDLIDDGTKNIVFPLDKWKCCTGFPVHRPLKQKDRSKIFIDYKVYLNTGGDLELARQSAYSTCKKFLLAESLWDYLR